MEPQEQARSAPKPEAKPVGAGVGRNTVTLLAASIIQKAIAFVYFALIARWLGVSDTGKYFFALSWSTMFSVVTDLGLTSVLIREVAKYPEKTERLLNQVLALKVPLTLVAMLTVVAGVVVMGYPPETVAMVALAAVVLALDAASFTFYATLRGHHVLKYESLGIMIGQATTLVVGLALLLSHASVVYLIFALMAGSAYNAVAGYVIVRRKLDFRFRWTWDRALVKQIVLAALPFFLAGAFVKVYANVDVVLLSKLKGDAVAGLYSVPYKLTYAFQFVPMAFTAALYPAMSRYVVTDKARLGEVLYRALWSLSVLVFPLVAGMIALSRPLIGAVYGAKYLPAAGTLDILILALIFIFLDFPLGSVLNANDRQSTQMKILGAAMIVSVVLNAALIPFFGMKGAAVTAVVSQATLFFSGLVIVSRFMAWPISRFVVSALKIAVSAAVMGLAVYFSRRFMPWPVSVVLGAFVYAAVAFAIGAVKKSDVKELLASVLRRNTPA